MTTVGSMERARKLMDEHGPSNSFCINRSERPATVAKMKGQRRRNLLSNQDLLGGWPLHHGQARVSGQRRSPMVHPAGVG